MSEHCALYCTKHCCHNVGLILHCLIKKRMSKNIVALFHHYLNIVPLSSALNENDLLKLNHYSNLKPLCSYNNRYIKKDKII